MKLLSCCVFSIAFVVHCISYGQSVNGVVLDSATREPVPFAFVINEQHNTGTMSNESGEFHLKVPVEKNLVLKVSHVAFSSETVTISGDKDITILLADHIKVLDPVEVTDRAYNIAKDIRKDLKDGNVQFGNAFYRQVSMHGSLATEFIEAFYNVSYTQNGIDKIKIDQARFGRKKQDSSFVFISYTNFSFLSVGYDIYSSLPVSIGKPFCEPFFDYYEFELSEEYEKNSEHLAKITYKPAKGIPNRINSEGYFVYNTTRKQLVEYVAAVDHALGADDLHDRLNRKLTVENPKCTWKIGFSDSDKRINFIVVDYRYDLIADSTRIPSHVFSKMIFYEQLPKPHRHLRVPAMDVENVAMFEEARYRPGFWQDNPVIKRTQQEETIIRSFEVDNAFGSYFK